MKEKNISLSIRNLTKSKSPNLPFLNIKNAALGKGYSLSLVFAGDKLTKKLNLKYRGKKYPPNVLSFPLGKESGEIFINLKQAKKESTLFGKSPQKFVGYLLIHGLLHLKGLEHGSTMEHTEKRIGKKFHI